MVTLQECEEKLAQFKHQFGDSFGITKLGIFGSVARGEITKIVILILLWKLKSLPSQSCITYIKH